MRHEKHRAMGRSIGNNAGWRGRLLAGSSGVALRQGERGRMAELLAADAADFVLDLHRVSFRGGWCVSGIGSAVGVARMNHSTAHGGGRTTGARSFPRRAI